MKRILILTILLMSSLAWAGSTTVVVGQVSSGSGGGGEAFCSSCTGSTIFCWEVTGSSVTITESGGCVESGGDAVGSVTSEAEVVASPGGADGYSLHFPTYSDYISFDLSENGLDDSGTIQFDLYVDTWGAGAEMFNIIGLAGEDVVSGYLYSTNQLRILHEGSNAGPSMHTNTSCALEADTWYTGVKFRWRVGVNPCLSITANGSTTTRAEDVLTTWTNQPSVLRLGNVSGNAGKIYIRNIKVYNTWVD